MGVQFSHGALKLHRYDPEKDKSLCGRHLPKEAFGIPWLDSDMERCELCERLSMPVSQGDNTPSKSVKEASIASTGAQPSGENALRSK